MIPQLRLLAAGSAVLLLFSTACATAKPPQQPPVDPLKEQVTILQKQLLELQNIQNETRRKIEEQTMLVDSLSSRIKALEEQGTSLRNAVSQIAQQQDSAPSVSPSRKKSANGAGTKKKKKTQPVRRQEQ